MNFRGQDLSGKDFSGKDLSYSNFRDANLSGCNFKGATLHFCNFKGSIQKNADFTDAKGKFSVGIEDTSKMDMVTEPPKREEEMELMGDVRKMRAEAKVKDD